ncbi:hypothetical protein [Streptomyces blastmyceticus]|uniref:Uncharacterized protein n=1 Tax=Streptomyces blastmyceticus TaxID=68180 RepID=A0ABP3GXE8_9ACTN
MNSLKGLGVCAVLAGIAYALTRVADTDQLLLGVTVVIITVCLITYAASIRRRRRDYRVAGE